MASEERQTAKRVAVVGAGIGYIPRGQRYPVVVASSKPLFWTVSRRRPITSSRGGRRPLPLAGSGSPPGAPRGTPGRSAGASPEGRGLQWPPDRDVIAGPSLGRRSSRAVEGRALRSRGNRRGVETSCQVPTPAEETPRDGSKRQRRSLSPPRERVARRRGVFF